MDGRNILIVEDEMITAIDLRNQLRRFGYEVNALAKSGDEAVRLSEELHPDLILMDVVQARWMALRPPGAFSKPGAYRLSISPLIPASSSALRTKCSNPTSVFRSPSRCRTWKLSLRLRWQGDAGRAHCSHP